MQVPGRAHIVLDRLGTMGIDAKGRVPMDRGEFERLLALNYAVVDALWKKKAKDVEFVYADTFARKVFQHAASAFMLWSQATQVRVTGIDKLLDLTCDWPSMEVLARACLETYLAFHYIYIEPGADQDAFQFRYHSWIVAGFAKRESFPLIPGEDRKQLADDATALKWHRRRIEKTGYFQSLKPGVRERVLAGRNWPPGVTLSGMAERVFGPVWGRAVYSYMCSHAHSDALSVVQMKQAVSREDTTGMADTTMSKIALVLAHMTASYAAKFVKARKVLASHPDRELNVMYANLAQYIPRSIGVEEDGL